jgi:methylmalonyl-CoA/ethylmalonyl-CoA epimerase
MIKVEHIGIAVKDLGRSNKLFEALLGAENYKVEPVDSEKVNTSFFAVGNTKIELLEGTDIDSPISRFLDKKGEGIHHIAFEVDDIRETIKNLEAKGFELISNEPKKGADNKLVAFVHPRSANGILVEICQEIRD